MVEHKKAARKSDPIINNVIRSFADFSDGSRLYGDDFKLDEIEAWFRDEKEAYFMLDHEREKGSYGYHALNWRHGFRHLKRVSSFDSVLGIGSAFGDELEPVLNRAHATSFLEKIRPRCVFLTARKANSMPLGELWFR